jgi:hypothetical protein
VRKEPREWPRGSFRVIARHAFHLTLYQTHLDEGSAKSGSKCEILTPSGCRPLRLRTRTLLDAVGTSHRLRCHKRPKSREETPKEGSDSGMGLGVATALRYLRRSRSREIVSPFDRITGKLKEGAEPPA